MSMTATCVVAPAPTSTTFVHSPKPLRASTATWNSKFPSGLSLDLSLPSAAYTCTPSTPYTVTPAKPRLRLPSLEAGTLPSRRFDPFAADDAAESAPVASTSALPLLPHPQQSQSQNTPPPSALARGRTLTPLTITAPASVSGPREPRTPNRRRAPSFSAGANTPRSLSSAPSPTPSAARPVTRSTLIPHAATPHVPLAPSPFHARHYPTPDARARLLARTLLNRIHAVGRPRGVYSCSAYSKISGSGRGCGGNGYESECGGRGYVRSRLGVCVAVC